MYNIGFFNFRRYHFNVLREKWSNFSFFWNVACLDNDELIIIITKLFILVLTSEFHIHSYRRIFFFLYGIRLFSNLGIKVWTSTWSNPSKHCTRLKFQASMFDLSNKGLESWIWSCYLHRFIMMMLFQNAKLQKLLLINFNLIKIMQGMMICR